MIIVDRALQERAASGRPVQVGMVGAGAMGRGIARQVFRAFPGLRLAAIANRTVGNAERAYREAGQAEFVAVTSALDLDDAVANDRFAVTDDPMLLCDSSAIDVLVEVTGTVDHAAEVVLRAISHGKHVVLMNAELDGTVGPLLKAYADAAGVIISACDGDQPGVEANLYRFVRGIGFRLTASACQSNSCSCCTAAMWLEPFRRPAPRAPNRLRASIARTPGQNHSARHQPPRHDARPRAAAARLGGPRIRPGQQRRPADLRARRARLRVDHEPPAGPHLARRPTGGCAD